MKLGVIIPLYNRQAMIGSALRSVLRQADSADLDVVVVDDGSTDGGDAIVRSFVQGTNRIRLVRQENRGVTRARETGLCHLLDDTELVTFLDSDDISPAGRFAAELKRFDENPGLDLTYGLMTLVDRIDDDRLEPADGSRSVTVRGVSLAAGLFRREWFSRLGGFDPQFDLAEDADFLFRLFERSPRFVLSDTVSVYYRRHQDNLTKQHDSLRRNMMLALRKSIERRRRDPTLASLDGIFDMTALIEARWSARQRRQHGDSEL